MRALFALLLFVLPPVAGATDPCLVSRHEERQQAGYWVVLDGRACSGQTSARHSERVLVTRGPPADNRSETVAEANVVHARSGDRSGPHAVYEHANASYEAYRVNAWYNSTRDAGGATRCTLHANVTQPRGSLVARHTLPFCVPQEAFLP